MPGSAMRHKPPFGGYKREFLRWPPVDKGLSIWTWRRYDVPPSRQMEIAFFFSGFMLWVGTMIGFYSSFQVPVRVIARQNGQFIPPAAPSNKGALLARAVPESGVLGDAGSAASGPLAGYDQWTAVYDISAHTVYLPNGTTLEAHSGLGDRLDDPRHVRERMRGATPPDVYELALREQLFHGVQALRLKPVGGGNIAAYANSQPRRRNTVGSADDASLIEPLAA